LQTKNIWLNIFENNHLFINEKPNLTIMINGKLSSRAGRPVWKGQSKNQDNHFRRLYKIMKSQISRTTFFSLFYRGIERDYWSKLPI
jgi:hypothetical protein